MIKVVPFHSVSLAPLIKCTTKRVFLKMKSNFHKNENDSDSLTTSQKPFRLR